MPTNFAEQKHFVNTWPDRRYAVIVADPPWSYSNKASRACADNHYPTMNLSDLMQLPMNRICQPDCVLFMWAVGPMTQEALDLVRAWGFKLKNTKAFTWIKLNRDGTPFKGLGNYTRNNSEDCLVAVRGQGLERLDKSISQVILERRTKHSQKPVEALRRIERLYGDVPRLEMFARSALPGWDSWGNEDAGQEMAA